MTASAPAWSPAPRDPLEFYHHRLDAIWSPARANYDFVRFEPGQAAEIIPKTMDFHLQSFAHPLPKPAVFTACRRVSELQWYGVGKINSDRKQPGTTALENVSTRGFRSPCASGFRPAPRFRM